MTTRKVLLRLAKELGNRVGVWPRINLHVGIDVHLRLHLQCRLETILNVSEPNWCHKLEKHIKGV